MRDPWGWGWGDVAMALIAAAFVLAFVLSTVKAGNYLMGIP